MNLNFNREVFMNYNLPKKGSGGVPKYDFEEISENPKSIPNWIVAKNYDHARSIRVCAINRGYVPFIRTVDKEIRVYIFKEANNNE